jgi:hypothetical protein
MQLLIAVPLIVGTALFLVIGNMGLALMGTAIAVNTFAVGWVGSLIALILGKAGLVVAKDCLRRRRQKA